MAMVLMCVSLWDLKLKIIREDTGIIRVLTLNLKQYKCYWTNVSIKGIDFVKQGENHVYLEMRIR